MLHNLVSGLTALGNGPAIGYLLAGTMIGVVFGVTPGLSGAVILSIILAFVYHINLTGTLCLFLGVHAASYFTASVTSILLNTPAHPEAFAVTFDGHPMARNGQAGRALGLSAASTCMGGIIGCAVLVGFIQIINYLPGIFHPPEYVALIAIAMLLVGTLGSDSLSKAIISVGIGLMISTIGPSLVTGTFRYTFNAVGLYSGISLVALALGLFAIPQMVMMFGTGTAIARQDMLGRDVGTTDAITLEEGSGRQVVNGILEAIRHWPLLIQSGLIGALTGIVPGMGGFTANFLSYSVARQTSSKRQLFGSGIPEGIIAPEGSSLAKEAGSMVPILGLGIPGSVGGALFIGALAIRNIRVGFNFASTYPVVPYEIVWIIAISGIVGTVIGALAAPMLAKVTRVPGPLLVPFVIALTILGPFLADYSFFAVVETIIFGILGFVMRRLGYSLAAFVLGLVLGPTLETNISLMRVIYPGFSFLHRPLADILFVIAIAILVLKAIEVRGTRKPKRRKVGAKANPLLPPETVGDSAAVAFPLLKVLMSGLLLAISVAYTAYGAASYAFTTALLPEIAGGTVIVATLFLFPTDLFRYVRYRHYSIDNSLVDAPAEPAPHDESGDKSQRESLIASTVTIQTTAASTDRVFAPINEYRWGINGQYTREFIAFIWIAGLIGACWLLGFIWGIPLFFVAYSSACARRFIVSRVRRLIFTTLGATLMWAVTYEMIGVLHLVYVART